MTVGGRTDAKPTLTDETVWPRTVRELMALDADWLRTLETVYAIKVSRDGHLVSLKYNQLASPMHVPLVQQCRGMVVDVEHGLIVAHGYNKFWNHGEEHAAEIDWSTARVQEKLDGSLMLLWWSPTLLVWRVSSSGHPTAGGDFGYDTTRTFADAFWETFNELGMKLPIPGACYMFELCAKENRIVVKHEKARLVLHGARWMETGLEVKRSVLEELAKHVNWEIVREFPISTIDECLRAVEALDGAQTEGFVVVDAWFNRVKIKSPAYVALHHLRGEGMSQRRAIELWQSGETTEVLVNFPEFKAEVDEVHGKIRDIIETAYRLWRDNRALPTKKEYAIAVKDHPCSAIAFKLRDGATSALDKHAQGAADPTIDTAAAIVRRLTVPAIQRLIGGPPIGEG